MTDLTTIIEMLKRSGIEYELEKDPEYVALIVRSGYPGFYSQFTFSAESGKLFQLEAYE